MTLSGITRTQYRSTSNTGSENRNSSSTRQKAVETIRISTLVMEQSKGTVLSVGEYIYPFTIPIPFDTHGSFELNNSLSAYAFTSLRFALLGKLKCDGLLRRSLKHAKKICIHQRYALPLPILPVLQNHTVQIRKLLLMKKGTLQYQIDMISSMVALHAEAVLQLSTFLDSTKQIDCIELHLLRKVQFINQGYHDVTKLRSQYYTGIQSGESKQQTLTIVLHTPSDVPTITNSILSISYFLELKFPVSGCKSISTEVPIQVCIPLTQSIPEIFNVKQIPSAPQAPYC